MHSLNLSYVCVTLVINVLLDFLTTSSHTMPKITRFLFGKYYRQTYSVSATPNKFLSVGFAIGGKSCPLL